MIFFFCLHCPVLSSPHCLPLLCSVPLCQPSTWASSVLCLCFCILTGCIIDSEKKNTDMTSLSSSLLSIFFSYPLFVTGQVRSAVTYCGLRCQVWFPDSHNAPHILLCVTQTSPGFSLLCIKRFDSVWQTLHGYRLNGFRRLNCSAVPCHYFLIINLPFPYGSTDVFLTVSVFLGFHTPSPFLSIWRHLCVLTVNLHSDPPSPPHG